MTERTGGCLCGAVRFTASDVETNHHACHCGMCRKWSGGPMLAAMTGAIRFETSDALARYESSTWAERGFCRRCGSSLFYFLKPTGQYSVAVGAFDDPTDFRLAEEIYVDHQPPGYAFAGARPRLTEAEVLARFAPDSDGKT